MRSHAPPRRRSSAGIFIVLFLIFGLFFIGAVFIVGVVAFTISRAETQKAHAMARQEMALRHAESARAEMNHKSDRVQIIRERGEPTSRPTLRNLPTVKQPKSTIHVVKREITLQLNPQGKVQVDGKPVEQKQIKNLLRKASEGREEALMVTIKADDKCAFGHVASLLSLCQELSIHNVRVAKL